MLPAPTRNPKSQCPWNCVRISTHGLSKILLETAWTHKDRVDLKLLISETSVVPFSVLPHAPTRRSVKWGRPAMTLSPSGSSSKKPVTVANVCRGLPVLSLLLLASKNGPRLPCASPMYLHDSGRVSAPGCRTRCVLQLRFYNPPVGLGKPGLVRPWVRTARSERVRRIIPCYVFDRDIE